MTRRETLGQALRRHREARGLSQERLSAATGISQSNFSNWERADRNMIPSVEDIAKIERALGLTPGALLIEAGYVELPTSTLTMLEVDPDLAPERREIVADLYRAQVERSRPERPRRR